MNTDDMFFEQLPKDQISLVEPLWKELNSFHGIQSSHFKEHFQDNTFAKRCEKLFMMDELGIFVAKTQFEIFVYCIASYHNQVGEIDSLFVSEKYRKNSVGKELMIRSMKWLTDLDCKHVNVSVAEGNEKNLGFYEKFGFRKRSYVLQR